MVLFIWLRSLIGLLLFFPLKRSKLNRVTISNIGNSKFIFLLFKLRKCILLFIALFVWELNTLIKSKLHYISTKWRYSLIKISLPLSLSFSFLTSGRDGWGHLPPNPQHTPRFEPGWRRRMPSPYRTPDTWGITSFSLYIPIIPTKIVCWEKTYGFFLYVTQLLHIVWAFPLCISRNRMNSSSHFI